MNTPTSLPSRLSMRAFAAVYFGVMLSGSSPVTADSKAPVHVVVGPMTKDVVLRYVPEGSYEMGLRSENPRFNEQIPSHHVKITQAFLVSEYEVSRGQYAEFVRATGHGATGLCEYYNPVAQGVFTDRDEALQLRAHLAQKSPVDGAAEEVSLTYGWSRTGMEQADTHPVVNVTWFDAVAFCKWLSNERGRRFRLPTEAEWEYACRAGSEGDFDFGGDVVAFRRRANIKDRSLQPYLPREFENEPSEGDGYAFTCPCGSFGPNSFRIFDMHGNVREWCSDWYDADYYRKSTVADPSGPAAGKWRVVRGGGWRSEPASCVSGMRSFADPREGRLDIGFRVVCEVVIPPEK